MARVYLGIGSNDAGAATCVRRGIAALDSLGTVRMRSSLYRSAPWGKLDQPSFVNAVVLLDTLLAPHALLDELKAVERRLGRVPAERWGPRVIDLDILLYDDLAIDDERLRVPHLHLRERAFVLVPLAELDSTFGTWRDALPADELARVKLLGLEILDGGSDL